MTYNMKVWFWVLVGCALFWSLVIIGLAWRS